MQTPPNWKQIVEEHKRESAYNKLIYKKHDPLFGTRISKFFLSGISALILGVILFALGVYGNPYFRGIELLGILVGVSGIVFIVLAVMSFREIDRTRLRSTSKKMEISSGNFRSH